RRYACWEVRRVFRRRLQFFIGIGQQGVGRLQSTEWCTCKWCILAPTARECFCCRECAAPVSIQNNGCMQPCIFPHSMSGDPVVLRVM
ncbi:unnamed protein product, partial [Ixodes pacificus]